jgi:hypothetical protein
VTTDYSSAPSEQDVNYVMEMFKHPANGWGVCAGLVAGSLAAVATGIGPALLIPIVLQAGLNGILSLFLPESPIFREAIDRKKRRVRREAAREHLHAEINKRVDAPHRHWETYHRMVEQRDSLNRAAKNTGTDLSLWDVERLDATTVTYLRLWLARLTIDEREAAIDVRSVQAQADEIERLLADPGLSALDLNRLVRARTDLDTVLSRRDSFTVQESAMAAQMLSIADGFSEVYHRIMANPTGEDLGSFLNDAVARMNVSEELDFAAGDELASALNASRAARQAVEASSMSEAMRQADSPAQGRTGSKQRNEG